MDYDRSSDLPACNELNRPPSALGELDGIASRVQHARNLSAGLNLLRYNKNTLSHNSGGHAPSGCVATLVLCLQSLVLLAMNDRHACDLFHTLQKFCAAYGHCLTCRQVGGERTCDPMLPARSVYPLEGAAATRPLPIVPPAPLTLSMTMDCPRMLPICSVATRAISFQVPCLRTVAMYSLPCREAC